MRSPGRLGFVGLRLPPRAHASGLACLVWALSCLAPYPGAGASVEVEVEVEEEVYRYQPANNGAGPMWCSGSTCVARVGDAVFASGLETVPDAKPLNNCRWVLWRRDATGWKRWRADDGGRTREPAPLACTADGGVFLSANPTLNPPDKEGGGPARPEVYRFPGPNGSADSGPPLREEPVWKGTPKFTEHSYRTFVADRAGGDLMLFQNIDYTHAEWSWRDATGRWAAQGQLRWPRGADYAKPQPVRVCYPTVAMRGRAVHFCGVSDIQEPNPEWRKFKKELTGRDWDYDFRRLFYSWTPDVTREPFREWIEVASRDRTGGWISPADAWVAPDGTVFLLWTERAIDERLRSRFFPDAKQSHSLRLARVRDGKVVDRRVLLESTEEHPGAMATAARFQQLADGQLAVLVHLSGGGPSRNELWEIDAEGRAGARMSIRLQRAFGSFFTATVRAGNAASDIIDLLGVQDGTRDAIGYARLRLKRVP